jgi:hypothetical protein
VTMMHRDCLIVMAIQKQPMIAKHAQIHLETRVPYLMKTRLLMQIASFAHYQKKCGLVFSILYMMGLLLGIA